MTSSPRTASDILLALEAKVDQLTSMVHAQDLNLRILSNKLNLLLEQMKERPSPPPVNPYTASAEGGVIPAPLLQNRGMLSKQPMIKIETDKLPIQETPQGMRRTARTDGPSKPPPVQRQLQIQDPSPPNMSAFKQQLEAQATPTPEPEEEMPEFKAFENLPPQLENTNKVAVIQRVVDKNGKSVFLAEIDILDEDNNKIFSTRTNGMGKWQASLNVGNYKIRISRRELVTKQKVEKYQNIVVDGRVSQLTLDQLIFDK